jgi:Zn-dependent alcohol dehydrogenase
VPVAQDQSLHRDPRDAGQGADARRHQPLLLQGQADPSLYGLLDLRELHRAARDRAREDPRGRAVRQVCYIGCGVTTGIGAVLYTAKVQPGANVVVFGLGGIGLNVIQGAKMVGAERSSASTSTPAARARRKFGMTALRQSEGREGRCRRRIVGLTSGGADYTFDASATPT